METRQTEMKQWRIVIMVAVSALTILFFVQLGSLTSSKASTSKGNRNKPEPSLKNDNVPRRVQQPTASSSSKRNISLKLHSVLQKITGNKSLNKTKGVRESIKHTHFCWEEEEVQEIGKCLRCSSYEKRVSPVCLLTGNKQLVSCKVSKKRVYKSCLYVKWIEERNFWTFEGVSFVFLLVSSLSIWQRNKKLDAIYREKLRKKVANDDV